MRLAYFFGLLVLLSSCNIAKRATTTSTSKTTFDWQGHRGARGLLPENTIPAFKKALAYPAVTTLELDVVITKDKQVILSHEPWISHEICSKADGTTIKEAEAKGLSIYAMTYAEVQTYDCGSRGNERFPEQKGMPTTKVTLAEMVAEIEQYIKTNKLERPNYNIEIKSKKTGDDIYHPKPEEFAALVLEQIVQSGIKKRTTVQSFDVRALQAVRKQYPKMPLVFLVGNEDGIATNLAALGFIPEIYSPRHTLLDKEKVSMLHAKDMKVIPWTVNEVARMQELIDMGVDGIITDYPDRIAEVLSP